MLLDTKAVKRRLKRWGDHVQKCSVSDGWPESIFKTIMIYGACRIDGVAKNDMQLYPDNPHAAEIDHIVAELAGSDDKYDKLMAKVLYINYCEVGTASQKQEFHGIASRTYANYLSAGVSYIRGCLNSHIYDGIAS